jgi:acetyl-CoA carboxylase alpha subunit
MQERTIFSVIAPEGAAAILYHDPGRAEELAASLRITARDLVTFGMIDGIVRVPDGGAASDPDRAATLVERASLRSRLARSARSPTTSAWRRSRSPRVCR